MSNFQISFLDHVALRVKSVEKSANWYSRVLGLKKYKLKEWNESPVVLLAGKSGIALFPLVQNEEIVNQDSRIGKVDHFAFNLTNKNFEKAKKSFEKQNIKYTFQNHYYFHSLYIKDLDNHTVELTTIVVEEQEFYKMKEK